MTTAYHTDHIFGAPLTSAEINAPLGELDNALGKLYSRAGINLLDYSVDTTGVTVCATAVQTAIVDAIAAGKPLIVPAGIFNLGTNTVFLTDTGLIGGTKKNVSIIGLGAGFSSFKYTGSSVAISSGNSTSTTPPGVCVIRDITIDGTGSSAGSIGLYLKRFQQNSALVGVQITNFQTTNMYLFKCYGMLLQACHFVNSAGWGALLDNCNGIGAVASRFSTNVSGGAHLFFNGGSGLPHGETDAGGAMAVASFYGCLFEGNTAGPGIRGDQWDTGVITGCYIENNAGNGQVELSGASGITRTRDINVIGNRFNGSSVSARGVWMDFSKGINIAGNRFIAHTTASIEATSNASPWSLGPIDSGDAVVVVDNSTGALGYYGNVIPFTLEFMISNPAAATTDGDVPLAADAVLSTDRMLMGGVWDVQMVSARSNANVTAGTIDFFPTRDGTSLTSPKATVTAGNTTAVATGHGVSPLTTNTLGCRFTTSAGYLPVTNDYFVVLSGVIRLF